MNLDLKQIQEKHENSVESDGGISYNSPQNGDFREPQNLKSRVNEPESERGIPTDLSVRKISTMQKVAIFVVGLFAVGLISAGVMRYGVGWFEKKPKTEKQTSTESAGNSRHDFTKGQKETLAAAEEEVEIVKPASAEAKTEDAASEDIEKSAAVEAKVASEPEDLRLSSPLDFKTDGSDGAAENVLNNSDIATATVQNDTQSDVGLGIGTGQQGLSARLNSTAFTPTFARQRGSTDFLLARGTGIPCVVMTRIVTTYPGVTKCQVSEDVYSANGKVLLVGKGSVVHGEQQSALMQGQARVFVAWSGLETPDGVTVNIDSLGADPLGGSGHPAKINGHFWKRFGGAIMISMIGNVGDGISNRQNRTSGNNNHISYERTSDAAQEIATEALRNSINIPPTGYVNQGERIMVYIVRDVDFSGVYELVETN